MGCSSSTDTAVHPLDAEQDEAESRADGRGDSAVSKGTADSGVVMESTETPVLPGAVPGMLPALQSVSESEADRITEDGPRPDSSVILEELLSEGIIPVGPSRVRSNGAGEAYSIMLDDSEGVRRRPPARLESLKATKASSLPSREEIEEKIRLAEERRKSREDQLKMRLRTKSARVRAPAATFSAEEKDDVTLTPVEQLQHHHTLDKLDPQATLSQTVREEAEGREQVREAAGDGRECKEETGRAGRREEEKETADKGWRVGEVGDGKEEEEEVTVVEELKEDQLLAGLGELENDRSFQHTEEKDEIF